MLKPNTGGPKFYHKMVKVFSRESFPLYKYHLSTSSKQMKLHSYTIADCNLLFNSFNPFSSTATPTLNERLTENHYTGKVHVFDDVLVRG